jgi:hypothetical protein
MLPPYLTTKLGQQYRVIAMPIKKPGDDFPAIGLYGVCKWTSSKSGACLNINGKTVIVPFDCIEEAQLTGIEDALLITAMLQNPRGALKILKGLWRLTKETSIRNLMECGELPVETLPASGKTKEDFAKQWEEASMSGALASEL